MTTKKEGARSALAIAHAIFGALQGDEGADDWVMQLLWLAEGLDKEITRHPWYEKMLFAEGETKMVKLRRLIETESTTTVEREAAVRALNRLREAQRREEDAA